MGGDAVPPLRSAEVRGHPSLVHRDDVRRLLGVRHLLRLGLLQAGLVDRAAGLDPGDPGPRQHSDVILLPGRPLRGPQAGEALRCPNREKAGPGVAWDHTRRGRHRRHGLRRIRPHGPVSAFMLSLGALGVLCVLFAFLYAFARWIDNFGIVDIAWSYSFIVLAVIYAAFGAGWPVRRALIAAVATLWGFRLGTHLLVR